MQGVEGMLAALEAWVLSGQALAIFLVRPEKPDPKTGHASVMVAVEIGVKVSVLGLSFIALLGKWRGWW